MLLGSSTNAYREDGAYCAARFSNARPILVYGTRKSISSETLRRDIGRLMLKLVSQYIPTCSGIETYRTIQYAISLVAPFLDMAL